MVPDDENQPSDATAPGAAAPDEATAPLPAIGRSDLKTVACFAGLLAAVAAAGFLLIYAM